MVTGFVPPQSTGSSHGDDFDEDDNDDDEDDDDVEFLEIVRGGGGGGLGAVGDTHRGCHGDASDDVPVPDVCDEQFQMDHYEIGDA